MWRTICRMKPIRICSLSLLAALFCVPVLAAPDLPNFHAVAPGIWRGAAPSEAGLRRLKAMGVKTVIDLRIAPKTVRREGVYARSLGFHWINLPMGAEPPTSRQVATLLSTLGRASGEPVFVHCQHGADRTGCMLGIYRVTRQGWTFQRAYAEMRQDGFDPRWGKLREAVRVRAKSDGALKACAPCCHKIRLLAGFLRIAAPPLPT